MTALDARPHWQVRNRSTDVTQFGNSQKEVTSNSFCDNDLNMTVPLVTHTLIFIPNFLSSHICPSEEERQTPLFQSNIQLANVSCHEIILPLFRDLPLNELLPDIPGRSLLV